MLSNHERTRFNAISLNSIAIMADVNLESKVERGPEQHLWPYLSTIFRFLSMKGLRFIKQCLTAMQEATADDQPLDHLDEYDDFFVKKRVKSTALMQLNEYLMSPPTETK